jgi:LuxR family maltose regulon positive regulatory protein
VELLRATAEQEEQQAADHARALLRAVTSGPDEAQSAPRPAVPGTTDDGRLSEREVAVLRLLATDLTGPQIAERLFVSVNTLRSHTKHIFTKLDVNTRRAAVRRGTELGLL